MTTDSATEPSSQPHPRLLLHPPAGYLRVLFALLMSATVFEGYDITIFHLCTPDIAHSFAIGDAAVGTIATLVRFGGILSFVLVASADLYGRKPIIWIAVLLYAAFTMMTALSRGMIEFTIFQSAAQMFLATEFAVAVTIVSEEFPDQVRGRAIAGLLTVAFLGVAFAAVAYAYVAPSRWGWRGMYLIGVAPLVLAFVVRRWLRETMRYQAIEFERQERGGVKSGVAAQLRDFAREIAGPYRGRLVVVALLWNAIGVIGGPTITFFSLFARQVHHWSAAQVSIAIVLAYLMGSAGSLLSGFAMDRIGRRMTTAIFFVCSGAAMAFMFQAPNFRSLMAGIIATMFSYQAARTAASALSTELFPTEIRAAGYSLAVQVLGQLGWALSPFLVGRLSIHLGLAGAASIFAVGPVLGAILVFGWIPETRGRSLEEISPGA